MKKIFNINPEWKKIKDLSFRSENHQEILSINSHFFEKNHEPWFPIMGEFHYSRFNEKQWKQEIAKMKSGGINVIASYVIWIHHEEIKNQWDFSKQRDLRAFVETCQEMGVYFFLRIGPWAHGEVRNGGFPDWLQQSGFDLRSDDINYLQYVKQYFQKIYQQVEGLFFKDGGPIIGLQIENEYGHAGGYRGEKGEKHMRTLKSMLLDIGFDVPFYTATGWGGAVVIDDEMLPVFGGYVDAPWSKSLIELPANGNFVFAPLYNDPLIASDFQKNERMVEIYEFNVKEIPYLTAELGGGLQVTKHRRPLVTAKDTEALALVKLGSGANLLGYYMYHGGINPEGKLSTLQESTVTGSYTDVPIFSYDFQAPLGSYGQFNKSYGALRKLHQSIQTVADTMAKSQPFFPSIMADDPENLKELRYSVRIDPYSKAGFLFINNHQKNRQMDTHHRLEMTIQLAEMSIDFPEMTINDGQIGMYPFNLVSNHYKLVFASATLFCIIENTWVFYHSTPEKCEIRFENQSPEIVVLTDDEANQSLKVNNQLFLSDAHLWLEKEQLAMASYTPQFKLIELLSNTTFLFECQVAQHKIQKKLLKSDDGQSYQLTFSYDRTADTDDIHLFIDFIGDRGELYDRRGKLISDWFTTGDIWLVSLKLHEFPQELILKIYPSEEETYYEKDIEKGCGLREVEMKTLYLKKKSLKEE